MKQLISECDYIFGKITGKGKEYFENGNVLFEGEYLNGKKIGKGKEYYENGYLLFEGEYYNGERNGKGIEYNFNGKIIFEGEYLKGERYKGKEYDYSGFLIFEGEYLNGERYKGKEYNDDGNIIFEGEYLNGQRWKGMGKEYFKDKKKSDNLKPVIDDDDFVFDPDQDFDMGNGNNIPDNNEYLLFKPESDDFNVQLCDFDSGVKSFIIINGEKNYI